MRRASVLFVLLIAWSCTSGGRPPVVIPTPPPDPSPVCAPGETCGCWHRPPGSDWIKLPDCKPPDPEPTPVTCSVDTPDATTFKLDVRWNLARTIAWVDATPLIHDRDWCPKYNTNPLQQVVCPTRPEGDPARVACDMEHGLPAWLMATRDGVFVSIASDDGDPFHVHVPAGSTVRACLASTGASCSLDTTVTP